MAQYDFVIQSAVAGILASLACGLGALPLLVRTLDVERKVGLGYGFAGGLMFSASVYNLLLPALNMGEATISFQNVILTLTGIFAGAGFLWWMSQSESSGLIVRSEGAGSFLIVLRHDEAGD